MNKIDQQIIDAIRRLGAVQNAMVADMMHGQYPSGPREQRAWQEVRAEQVRNGEGSGGDS